MSKLYSPSVRGFFDRKIHGDKTPPDAVEITDERWRELLDANAKGMDIVPDENGYPQSAPHVMSGEQLKASLPIRRSVALRRASEAIERHRDEVLLGKETTLTDEQYRTLVAYRSSIREAEELPEVPPFLKS